MADIKEVTEEEERAFEKWLAKRPSAIQELGRCFKPWKLYELMGDARSFDGANRVVPVSFNENGTITVAILARFNDVTFERQVFGLDPANLRECDLPAASEKLGQRWNEEETLAHINQRRSANGLPPLTLDEYRNYK